MKKLISLITVIFEFLLNRFGLIQFEGEPENIEISVNEQKFTVPKADFLKAAEAKKIAIKDEKLLIFAKKDYDLRTANLESTKYNEGKKAGSEITAKEIRDYAKEKYNLDIDAHEDKDYKNLLEKMEAKIIIDAKIPVDKKVQEHEKTIGELRGNLTKLQGENEQLKSEKEQIANDYIQKEHQLEINNTLNLLVPEKAVTETQTRRDVIALFRANGYDAKMIDGKIVAVNYNKDPKGEVVKHPITLEPEPLQKVLTDFVTAKKLIIVEGGRGNGDNTGNDTAGTWDAFIKEMADKGIQTGSEKFAKEQQLRIKNKTLKM